jgi:hypothetical protein
MDEVLVPLIKEERSSDDEADPLSPNTNPRNLKVGYVKKFTSGIYYMRISFPLIPYATWVHSQF